MFGFLAAPTLEAARSEIVARTAAKLWVSLATRMVQSAADYAGAFDAFRAEGAAGIMGSTIFSGDAPLLSQLATERGYLRVGLHGAGRLHVGVWPRPDRAETAHR